MKIKIPFLLALLIGGLFLGCVGAPPTTPDGRKIYFEDYFSEENTQMGRPARWQWWVNGSVLVREVEDAPEGYGPRVMQLGTNSSSTAHIGLEVEDETLWNLEDYQVRVLWTDRYIYEQMNDADFHIGLRFIQPESAGDPVEFGYEVEIDGDDTDATNLIPEAGATHFHLMARGELTRALQNTSVEVFPRPEMDQWYWTLVEAQGDVLRAKTWKYGTEEPGWMLETIDPEREFSSGGVRIGVWSGAVDVAYVSVEEASGEISTLVANADTGDVAENAPWQSELLKVEEDGSLSYFPDETGHILPDFSYAGYQYGAEIPEVPVRIELEPVSGDNTENIQQAIDRMADFPLIDGFRGAVLLKPGLYPVEGSIKVNVSGIVLRGSGSGGDPASNTVLQGIGNSLPGRSILTAGYGVIHSWDTDNTAVPVTTDLVPQGSLQLEVANPALFEGGDRIIVRHPCTREWLDAIGGGGTASDPEWGIGQLPILYYRTITAVEGNTLVLDAPLYYPLDRSLSQATVSRYDGAFMRENIGVENLRVDIVPGEGQLDQHAETAISVIGLENGWVRNTETLHFQLSGVRTASAVKVSVLNNRAFDPVQIIEAPWMYNFNAFTASQLILFSGNYASGGRHHYVVNGTSTASGIVFHDNESSDANATNEGHRQWSTGILYDNHRELDGPKPGMSPILLALYNRGDLGTGHGWSAANSVAWNCDVNRGMLVAQQPPTAQNFAIGCSGERVTGSGRFDFPSGHIEGSNRKGLEPASLYEAQLAARRNSQP